jgi:uncharacterized RDD family membrane protein YckC
VKCPKCGYLGFETGDRCKNCGYDFSLLERSPASGSALESKPGRALPLFTVPGEDDDDEPLIRMPAAPRAPLSVRKTPDTPRTRALSRPSPQVDVEPPLRFTDAMPFPDLPLRHEAGSPLGSSPARAPSAHVEASRPGPRLGAALIDLVILFAIDAAVVYFTLRMAALPLSEWRALPVIPLLAFLGLLKFAYFCAFTAVGGQTIGKMALAIRVVTEDNAAVDGARAIRRTLAGAAALALGAGFVPALFGAERRAFHDRVAHTRVIALHS